MVDRFAGDGTPESSPREFAGVQGVDNVDIECRMNRSSFDPVKAELRADN
jgi:hypothetical protein